VEVEAAEDLILFLLVMLQDQGELEAELVAQQV
jgi:hypothetical protein